MYIGIGSRKEDPETTISYVNKDLSYGLEFATEGVPRTMPAIERNIKALKEIKE
jgi:hypothetical protein